MSQPPANSSWAPHRAREAALREAEAALAADPASLSARFECAVLLDELGRRDEARQAYLDILARAPNHAGTLNNLGTLLFETGYRTAARSCYQQAVTCHPNLSMGHVNLGNLLLADGNAIAAQYQYEAALRLESDHADAHRGLALALAEMGDERGSEQHRRAAFAGRAVTTRPYRGAGPPLPVLLLAASMGGNIRTETLIDEGSVAAITLVPEYFDAAEKLPPHRVIFNTIGDADLSRTALVAARRLLADRKVDDGSVINLPTTVLTTGRELIARRLVGLADVIAPIVVALPREEFRQPDMETRLAEHGLGFPLLVRSAGFHTGRHFIKLDRPAQLAEAALALPGRFLFAIQYLDARGAAQDDHGGGFRKYRAMIVDGALYPLHLAVSDDWKVHYFTAAMKDRPEARREEESFLADMASAIGPAAMAGLERVRDALGLDYGGIDFALDKEGRLIVFEANAAMAVIPPDEGQIWDYRREAVDRVIAAFRAMLVRRARIG